jgi:hypothetical protein
MKSLSSLTSFIVVSLVIQACGSISGKIPDGVYASVNNTETVVVSATSMEFNLAGIPKASYHYNLGKSGEISLTIPANIYGRGVAAFKWRWNPPHLIRTDKKGVVTKFAVIP